VQTSEGWAHIAALTSFVRHEAPETGATRLLPVRQLDFRDERTARIFDETHDLGVWVVNHDELLDRRQLQNQAVRVIRYKQAAAQGRNTIISSRAPLSLLRSMIVRRLELLHLDLQRADLERLADKLIADANDVSGDIVLRAAKRGESASELIGVVLSRYLTQHTLGPQQLVGWYFLDDYAAWLGAREETQADIVALAPSTDASGRLRLQIVVTEAKYVEAASLAPKRRESEKQLRDTVHRIRDAVEGEHRLDRESWLSRLGDLLLDGIQVPASSHVPLAEWRRAVREGECDIEITGFSHVFVPNPTDGSVTAEAEIPNAPGCTQQTYGRQELRDILFTYLEGAPPKAKRQDQGGTKDRVGSVGQASGGAAVLGETLATVDQRSATAKPAAHIPSEGTFSSGLEPIGRALTGVAATIERLIGSAPVAEEDEAAWLGTVAVATRSALQQLGLQAKPLGQTLTPNAAILRFAGSSNLTVEQVLKKRSELLTTHGLGIISVRPEAGAVAIYVARPRRRMVTIESLWDRWRPTMSDAGNQDLVIGVREEDNELLVFSPGRLHAPHTLIAGSTGSGKSVLVQSIILGIAVTNTPAQARIVLIDPKQGVDYFAFDNLPHLDGGVIDEQPAAVEKLEALVEEMDRRYRLFKAARVPNLAAYNAKASSPDERLPAYWVIHDEFAEWMLTDEYKSAVTSTVGRLGVKARAAGIYLLFAAQRPDANVVPVQLRSQLGNRLILRVDSEGTSEIALGEKGAERLLGRGHMLARLEGESALVYAQAPFASEAFIESVVAAIVEEG
jgi:S-DNA-T family DNA segregation ATPase FtsK/SpoIIIE